MKKIKYDELRLLLYWSTVGLVIPVTDYFTGDEYFILDITIIALFIVFLLASVFSYFWNIYIDTKD